MVLIRSRTRASPRLAIFSGGSASLNRAGVALLTPASVACADSTTATRSVNGLMYCNSPRGFGLAAAKRRNASSTSALVHCGSSPWAASLSALPRALAFLTRAALPLRAAFILCPAVGLVFRLVFLCTMFLYTERHDQRQERRQRRRRHFGRRQNILGFDHAAPLAQSEGLSHLHALPRRPELYFRNKLRADGRVAGMRLLRARRGARLHRVPRQLSHRARL